MGSRIGAFSRGLTRRGWHVTVIDSPLPHATVVERLLRYAPTALRSMLQHVGVEGDVQPVAGWCMRRALRGVVADIVVVSVPPFSLLGAATTATDPEVPLILDYRDPWSARHTAPMLARVTRPIERRAVRQAAAVVYAGAPALGDLFIRHLRLPTKRVIWVPNGFDTADIDGLSGATGHPLGPVTTGSRRELYERLEQADAAVVTIDDTSAVESRIPAKVYDYLATGVPVIAVCPPGAALLQITEAHRFHHVHHRDLNGLITLLRRAMRDRAALRIGRLGEGLTREPGIETLHTTLRRLLPSAASFSAS